MVNPKQFLFDLFSCAVSSVSARECLPPFLSGLSSKGHTLVIGAGKGAAEMAQVVENNWEGQLTGLVVTPYGHSVVCKNIEVVEAAHPVTDEAGQRSALRILQMVQGRTVNDLVICLITGGGSSLLALPAEGITLKQKQDITKALLKSGANISEMNCVRKHLSSIKGGRLALACAPAQLVTLLISDVPGDDPKIIASGPTFPDNTTCQDALDVLNKYGIETPSNVLKHLKLGKGETPKPGDTRFSKTNHFIIATAQKALEAAAERAKALGITPYIISDLIEGEASDCGIFHAAIAKQVSRYNQPFQKPCVLLSGGETTVTVRGRGRGGRNTEFLLNLAMSLNGYPGIYAIACDTDGIDGTENNAGAFCSPESMSQARKINIDVRGMAKNNDSYTFFSALDDLVITGPTRTNVNDFRAVLIL